MNEIGSMTYVQTHRSLYNTTNLAFNEIDGSLHVRIDANIAADHLNFCS